MRVSSISTTFHTFIVLEVQLRGFRKGKEKVKLYVYLQIKLAYREDLRESVIKLYQMLKNFVE